MQTIEEHCTARCVVRVDTCERRFERRHNNVRVKLNDARKLNVLSPQCLEELAALERRRYRRGRARVQEAIDLRRRHDSGEAVEHVAASADDERALEHTASARVQPTMERHRCVNACNDGVARDAFTLPTTKKAMRRRHDVRREAQQRTSARQKLRLGDVDELARVCSRHVQSEATTLVVDDIDGEQIIDETTRCRWRRR